MIALRGVLLSFMQLKRFTGLCTIVLDRKYIVFNRSNHVSTLEYLSKQMTGVFGQLLSQVPFMHRIIVQGFTNTPIVSVKKTSVTIYLK